MIKEIHKIVEKDVLIVITQMSVHLVNMVGFYFILLKTLLNVLNVLIMNLILGGLMKVLN